MKIGIYIDGLAQSVQQQSVVKYATRLKNEMNFHTDGISHELKVEKITYNNERESNVVSIIARKGEEETTVYKLYEFHYGELMTDNFKKKNILLKNVLLFGVVLRKFPVLLKRFFLRKDYDRPFQTFYIFFLFFIIAAAILFMVPATLTLISNLFLKDEVVAFIHDHSWLLSIARFFGIDSARLKQISEAFVSFISIILLLVPQASTIITSLATEFVCAHYYLQYGQEKQDILGNIDQLFEYIAEHEKGAKLHIHSYSYGSLVAIDYLFPYGKKPSGNMLERTEALITIGTPVDFINSYYPGYYADRSRQLEEKIKWLNVFSVSDALGSNFRHDKNEGKAQYGLSKEGMKPVNINYEVVRVKKYSFSNFIFLNSLKMHGMYWSEDTDGQSCLNPIYLRMKEEGLL